MKNKCEFVEYFKSPIGYLKVVSDGVGVVSVTLEDNFDGTKKTDKYTEAMTEWLKKYFSGNFEACTVPMNPKGSDFQKRVWKELGNIGWGSSATYGEIALRIGNPKAVRAVGSAVGKNPVLIAIPCHRVLSKCGLGGFSALGGVETKKKLLLLEGLISK